jgi:hypothetical protein
MCFFFKERERTGNLLIGSEEGTQCISAWSCEQIKEYFNKMNNIPYEWTAVNNAGTHRVMAAALQFKW